MNLKRVNILKSTNKGTKFKNSKGLLKWFLAWIKKKSEMLVYPS